MILDEQELRQRLTVAASQASAARFTMDGLISRIRRRRARILGLVSGSLLAVAAIAVAIPAALSGPGTPTASRPPIAPFQLSFTVTVNGHARRNESPPRFTVTPGEHLSIHIAVIIPVHARLTTLWLGVTKDELSSPGRDGQRPPGMRPVLAHTRQPLTPGPHTFRLTWTAPAHLRRGTTLSLAAAWATRQEDDRAAQFVAEFVSVHRASTVATAPRRHAAELSLRDRRVSGRRAL
ncbi:MAG: hypothetical protein ABSA03_07040 [Streptosporangiaceae bacterium]|jgi:hypothetical protein